MCINIIFSDIGNLVVVAPIIDSVTVPFLSLEVSFYSFMILFQVLFHTLDGVFLCDLTRCPFFGQSNYKTSKNTWYLKIDIE